MISPRQLFQNSLKPDSSFRSVMKSDEMEKALVFALAQMAIGNPSADELIGANRFVSILKGLGDPEDKKSQDVDSSHRLNHSVFPVVEHALEKKPDRKK